MTVFVLYSDFINDNVMINDDVLMFWTCQVTLLVEETLYSDVFLHNLFCVCEVIECVLGQ